MPPKPHDDEYLDRVVVGPRDTTPKRVVLVDPDPDWPRQFAAHEARIRAALGSDALAVEHIGSTSVPGLRAKPRVDVLVRDRKSTRLNSSHANISYAVF